jgi:hypothetical protein
MNAGDTDSSDSTRKMLREIQVASYYRFFEQKETKETKWNSEIYASREETQRLYYEKGRERLNADDTDSSDSTRKMLREIQVASDYNF